MEDELSHGNMHTYMYVCMCMYVCMNVLCTYGGLCHCVLGPFVGTYSFSVLIRMVYLGYISNCSI